MKNKIAIIEYGFLPGYFDIFADLCKKNGIKIDLFTFKTKTNFSDFAQNIYYLKSKCKRKSYESIIEIEKEIKSLVNIDNYDYFLSDDLGLSFSCNVFHNISLREKINLMPNFIYRKILELGHYKKLKIEKEYYKNCPKIFVVSNYLKNDYHKNCNVDIEKIFVIYPGTNNKNFLLDKREKNNEFTIGAITCGFNTKGGYNILRGLKKFIKKYPNIKIKVKIINPKFKKFSFLNLYLKLFKLDEIVEMLPYHKDINEFYKTLNCLICASNYEAFGRIVTESMSIGLPVIVASNVGASDIIEDGENGFLFDANENKYENLADKIKEIYDKKDNLNALTQKAIMTANNLNWENFARNVFDILYKEN